MSAASELIRQVIKSHANGDDSAFRAAVQAYIDEERRKNHHVIARDLERLLADTDDHNPRGGVFSLLGIADHDLPHDKERSAPLLEVIDPQRDLEDVILTPTARESFDRIVLEQRRSEHLRSYGLRPIGKVLFCGPPGCGKTVAAEAIANTLYLPLVVVRFDAVISSYLGDTAANLRKVFTFARSRPMVMLFDEFDAIGKHRIAVEEHGELKRVVNSFLQMLDGFRGESLLIAATNHQGLLDPALWRRFDEVVAFERPSERDIVAVLRRHLRQIGIAPGVLLEEVGHDLIGASHADVERIARDAIKQTVLDGRTHVGAEALDTAVRRHRLRSAISDTGRDDALLDEV
jgi:SpoVK/Ycf46/Vps4 family AAA+-type ATPase